MEKLFLNHGLGGIDDGLFLRRSRRKKLRFEVIIPADGNVFVLPLVSTGSYDFVVNWGDGNTDRITSYNDLTKSHTYAVAGTYNVMITGGITGWKFDNNTSSGRIGNVSEWGPLKLTNTGYYFYGCSNLTVSAVDELDLSGITNMNRAFASCGKLSSLKTTNWDTSNVTNMSYAFYNCDLLSNLDVSNWDTSNVTTTSNMFYDCDGLENLDVSNWDISSLTSAINMFIIMDLTTEMYDALILSWGLQAQTLAANFHGGNSKYTPGGAVEAARDAWIAKGWTITDGGPAV